VSQRDEGNGFVKMRGQKTFNNIIIIFFISPPFPFANPLANPLASFGKLDSSPCNPNQRWKSDFQLSLVFLILSIPCPFFHFLVYLFISRVDLEPPLESES